MEVTQEGQKCIFILCMEVPEEDMEVQEEIVVMQVLDYIPQKPTHLAFQTMGYHHITKMDVRVKS